MKKILSLIALLQLSFVAIKAQSVSVNNDGTNADASSILDVKSTSKGFLIPRMTSVQRSAIASPALGLLVFDTDTKTIWAYSGITWVNLTAAGSFSSFALPYDTTLSLASSAFRIGNNGGTAIEGSSSGGSGVYGNSVSGAGVNALSNNGYGIISNSINNGAIYAFSNNAIPTIKSTNTNSGSAIEASATNGSGIYASSVSGAGINALSTDGFGLIANSANASAVYAFSSNANPAIKSVNSAGDGLYGASSGNAKSAIRGEATGSGISNGVYGTSTSSSGNGVYGYNNSGVGVLGSSTSGYGVSAFSSSGTGLRASSTTGVALDVYGKIKISGTGTVPGPGYVLTSIDNSGNVDWKIDKVAFGAFGKNTAVSTAIQYNAWTKIHFGPTGLYDFTSSYHLLASASPSNLSSAFVALVTGAYHFEAGVSFGALMNDFIDGEISLKLNRNGTISSIGYGLYSSFNQETYKSLSVFISKSVFLQAGDIVYVEALQRNSDEEAVQILDSNTFFTGNLVATN